MEERAGGRTRLRARQKRGNVYRGNVPPPRTSLASSHLLRNDDEEGVVSKRQEQKLLRNGNKEGAVSKRQR